MTEKTLAFDLETMKLAREVEEEHADVLAGKTGPGIRAPEMLREGRTEEVLGYCETDARLVASLYRVARDTGKLYVDGYHKKDGERVELGRFEVPTTISVY